mmetsp:Transcript_48584/g.140784  ORF Transcript_48584/g.140784 Transcript_48584/m.140784 type:complete len:252 (+) Transcript_48584:1351-2106(+)
MLPYRSTTDSSGRAPEKPAASGPKTTACTVARSCLSVRKQSLFPCLRLLCTRARTQTFWSLSSGSSLITGVHCLSVFFWLWMKRLPKACCSKSSCVKSGPLNFASRCLCCSSSRFRFSSSLAFLASSLAFFFSSFLPPPSPATSASRSAFGDASALGFGSAFGFGSALGFASAFGAAAVAAGLGACAGAALAFRSFRPSWCTQVSSHRTVFGCVALNFSSPAFSSGFRSEHAAVMSARVSRWPTRKVRDLR